MQKTLPRATLDPDGRIGLARILEGEEPWSTALLQALRTWRFSAPPDDATVSFKVAAEFVPGRGRDSKGAVRLDLSGLREMAILDAPAEPDLEPVQAAELPRTLEALKAAKADIGDFGVNSSADVAKVSVIGIGMRSHAGVAAMMFKALAEKGINILAITTSEIKISVLIDAAYAELAVRTLHSIYGLDAD